MAEYQFKPPYDPPPMQATQEEMRDAKLPLEYRDFCAHLLIPLNKCRSVPRVCMCQRLSLVYRGSLA